MKMEDILTLCKAGFTAEQIAVFTSEQKQQEQKQHEQKQQEQKQHEQKQQEQKQHEQKQQEQKQHEQKQHEQKPDENTALLNAISALTAKIKTLNIQNSHMQETEQSVDDILASVILPNGGSK